MSAGDYAWNIRDFGSKTYLIISKVVQDCYIEEIYRINMDDILIEYDRLGYDT